MSEGARGRTCCRWRRRARTRRTCQHERDVTALPHRGCRDTLEFYPGALGVRVVRKHIAWMIDAEFGAEARETRKAICMLEDPSLVREALVRLFDDDLDRAAA